MNSNPPHPTVALDHIVVAASTLETGQVFVRSRLGITVPLGGVHDHMATHNCVGRVGKNQYLEIIAINPDAKPDRARWFGLDTPDVQQRLQKEGAFLYHWVVNTTDIRSTLATCTEDVGPAIAMSRGDLNWKVSVRDDGRLQRDGLMPTVIEWPDIPHPSNKMPDLNIRLDRISLQSPDPDGLVASLKAIDADGFVDVATTPAKTNRITATFLRGQEELIL